MKLRPSSPNALLRRRRPAAALTLAATLGALATPLVPSTAQASTEISGTLRILVGSAPGSDLGFQDVDALFEKQYPKVNVEFEAVPDGNLDQIQSARISAGTLDVTVLQTYPVPSYVPAKAESDYSKEALAGDWVNLTQLPFEKKVAPSVLAGTGLDGQQYDFPLGLSYYTGVYYNKAIFAKYHLSIPTTFNQFITLCQTLKSDGLVPLGIGGKDVWPAGLVMLAAVQGLYPSLDDKLGLNKGLWTGTVGLKNSGPEEVLDVYQQIVNYAEPNWEGVPYESMPGSFVAGQFAMTPDGTWDEPTIASINPKFKFGYFPLPTSNIASHNALLGGKVDQSLGIPSNSKNIPAAEAYLSFMSQPKIYSLFISHSGFGPDEANISVSPFLQTIAKYTTPFSIAWDQVFSPNPDAGVNATAPFNYSGLAPLGSFSTVAAASSASQKDWAAGLTAIK